MTHLSADALFVAGAIYLAPHLYPGVAAVLFAVCMLAVYSRSRP